MSNVDVAKVGLNWRIERLKPADTVPTNNLGTGTANSTTFLRGDQTWAVPSGGGGSSAFLLYSFNLDLTIV
jgi:hypothetical protein